MKGSAYTVVYAAALGCVCALLLTAVGRLAAPYRQANAKAEEIKSLLEVLEVPVGPRPSSQELVQVFEKYVQIKKQGDLTLYVYDLGQGEKAVAALASGPGLWGPIKGFIAFNPGMKTIRGVTFHEQEETPGLGGEIASKKFREQFKGKALEADGKVGIQIRKGSGASAPNEVDAITGATMTSSKVEALLNAAIRRVVQEQ